MIFALSCGRWLLRRPRPHVWGPLFLAAALSLPAPPAGRASPETDDIEQPVIDVRPVAPGTHLALPYWPFEAHSGSSTPTLMRVDVDARVRPDGCGPIAWSKHPVQASKAAGPFCVGLLEGIAKPLLVVGRPGGVPYIVLPSELEVVEDAEGGRTVQLGQPTTPLPAVVEAIQRWAAAPEQR